MDSKYVLGDGPQKGDNPQRKTEGPSHEKKPFYTGTSHATDHPNPVMAKMAEMASTAMGKRPISITDADSLPNAKRQKTTEEAKQTHSDVSIQQASTSASHERPHSDAKESSSHDDIQLIKSISDRDIDDLQNTVRRICDKYIHKPGTSEEVRQPYIDARSAYESAFQSIRGSLKGKTLDERIEIIRGYLKDEDINTKFLVDKLLIDKRGEQYEQSRLESIKRRAVEPSGSYHQTEASNQTDSPQDALLLQGLNHYSMIRDLKEGLQNLRNKEIRNNIFRLCDIIILGLNLPGLGNQHKSRISNNNTNINITEKTTNNAFSELINVLRQDTIKERLSVQRFLKSLHENAGIPISHK